MGDDFQLIRVANRDTIFIMDVKDWRSDRKTTLDNHMKRAFATLALNFLKNKDDSFVVVPDASQVNEKYQTIFGWINGQIVEKDAIPELKEYWN